ncbi:hypothetical protein fugu_005593 [Takifugu bimaculatus]|uniref:Uncharacterized protein n=1 Tax=Takifugu bimaculatus TaxID=433685 RepID=A0A4Z2B4V4_9TELE|nr:hypothetical protein fugu_005593 [Takifugu bimaculatus]
MERTGDQPPWPKYSHTKGLEEQHLTHFTGCMRKVGKKKRWLESVMNENFRFRLFSRARRASHRSPGPGTLPGVRMDRKKAARKARVEETPKCLTTKPERPAARQETEEELSSIAAISLFTVKKSTVSTSSIKNRF